MKFAVIIVAYAGDAPLERALRSVLRQDIARQDFELCVVANRPHEDAKREFGEEVDVWVEPGENVGASAGRNLGVARTTAPVLCFLDDDGVADPGFLSAMRDLMTVRPEATVVRGRVQPLHYPMVNCLNIAYDQGDEVRECLFTIEGATCLRREHYEAVGGYNEGVFHREGSELFDRLLEKYPSATCMYNPRAILYHDYADGFAGLWKKGKRIAVSPCVSVVVSERTREYTHRILQAYPLQRASLRRRLYKAPAELVLRLSQWWHRPPTPSRSSEPTGNH